MIARGMSSCGTRDSAEIVSEKEGKREKEREKTGTLTYSLCSSHFPRHRVARTGQKRP